MANSKMPTKDHLSSRATHPSSSTQGSKATQDSSRAMVLHRVAQVLSILTTHRDKVSNMGVTDWHSLDPHSHRSRGLMGTTRGSMETTSSEEYFHSSSQNLLAVILSPQHCGHLPVKRPFHSI